MAAEVLTIKETGKFALPKDIVERYQFNKENRFRIIETQNGVLLVPLTDQPMSDELKTQLEEWQPIGTDGWEMFEFEEIA